MKNLGLVSFVGVDVHTNLDEIRDFKSDFICEWSVLYSDTKSLTNHTRYPSYQFCKDFLDFGANSGTPTSLHLCGEVIGRYLKQEQDVMDLVKKAYRVQLNLNIHSFPDHEALADNLISINKQVPHVVILQQNKTKAKFMETFLGKQPPKSRFNILHDGSGGFGREITEVSQPNDNHFTGYAGGLKPENVKKIVDLIENNNPNDRKYYIDMESGVRTDNVFSIEKCRQVITNLTQG